MTSTDVTNPIPPTNGAIMSRLKEPNEQERHQTVVITSGKLWIFFDPQVGSMSERKYDGCNGVCIDNKHDSIVQLQ